MQQTTLSGFVGVPPPKPPEPEPDVECWAAVYHRTLQHVSDDVPLKGTSYIGQAVRGGFVSAQAAAEVRWKEEENAAKRDQSNWKPKEVGLLAATTSEKQ